MKKYIFFIFILIQLVFLSAQQVWRQKQDFPDRRYNGIGFSLNGKGYVGLGWNPQQKKDFWEYDTILNQWTQKADFLGGTRSEATSFVIGNTPYVGLGRFKYPMKEFYKYDPNLNKWTRLNDFKGEARFSACSFIIGKTAYVGCGSGSSSVLSDFWKYENLLDTWIQIASLPRPKGVLASGFSVQNKGYIITDGNQTGPYSEVWQYEPTTDKWSQKKKFPGRKRFYANGFVLCDKIYFGGGLDTTAHSLNDYWMYDPATDVWLKITGLPDSSSSSSAIFTIGNKGYICGGYNLPKSQPLYLTSLWQFDPGIPCNSAVIEDIGAFSKPLVYPNPISDVLTLNIEDFQLSTLKLYNQSCQLIFQFKFNHTDSVNISKLKSGFYYYEIVHLNGHKSYGKIQKI
jgi:N-acetylneuraminic acid mutarotase